MLVLFRWFCREQWNRVGRLSAGIALGLGSLGGCVVDNEFYDPPGETSESATTTGDDAGSVGELTGDPGTTGEPGTTASTGTTGTSDPQTTTASPATTDPTTGETTDGDPSICGDGIVDEEAGERCDDGDKNTNDGSEGSCTTFCLRPPEVEFVELPVDIDIDILGPEALENAAKIECPPETHMVGLKVFFYANGDRITGAQSLCAPLVLTPDGGGAFSFTREIDDHEVTPGDLHGYAENSSDSDFVCPTDRPFISSFEGWAILQFPPSLVAVNTFCASITLVPEPGGYAIDSTVEPGGKILGNPDKGVMLMPKTGCAVPDVVSHLLARPPAGLKQPLTAIKAVCNEIIDTANN